MTIKENLLKRIHDGEDCPICMDIMKVDEKVYTEPCNHIYCIQCLGKWCVDNITCPMDRLKLRNVHVYNPIEADIKVVEIKHFKRECIYRERHNVFEVFTGELVKILSGCMQNYNHVISLSNSLQKIYEINIKLNIIVK